MYHRSVKKVSSRFKQTDHIIAVKDKTSLETFDPAKCKTCEEVRANYICPHRFGSH